jgi:hypothetical protein
MTLSWDQISELVLNSLTPEERLSSVVYLEERVLPQDAVLEVDGEQVRMPWPAVKVFVDLEPTANWGHDCRYVLVNAESGELCTIDARFPPFLHGVPDGLRVVLKGEDVPEWAVARS